MRVRACVRVHVRACVRVFFFARSFGIRTLAFMVSLGCSLCVKPSKRAIFFPHFDEITSRTFKMAAPK